MESVQLVRSVGPDEKSHPVLKRFRQIWEEFEGALIRPVKVVDRQDDGRSSREVDKDRGEGAETAIANVRIGERVSLRVRPPRDVRHAAQRIDERPERPPRFRFDALPVENLGTAGSRLRQERAEKPTLTDPGIARDKDCPTHPPHCLGERGIERGKLSLAPDECRTKDSARRTRCI